MQVREETYIILTGGEPPYNKSLSKFVKFTVWVHGLGFN